MTTLADVHLPADRS